MKENLLPHYWKMIALGLFVLSMAVWFANTANPGLLNLDPYKLNWFLKIIILSSLLIFVSTKEKNENERTARLRLNCMFSTIFGGGLYIILEFSLEILFQGKNAELISGYELMMLMLVIYYLSFYIKKNIKTVNRG